MMILSVDLGKFNTVCCFYATKTRKHRFATIATTMSSTAAIHVALNDESLDHTGRGESSGLLQCSIQVLRLTVTQAGFTSARQSDFPVRTFIILVRRNWGNEQVTTRSGAKRL